MADVLSHLGSGAVILQRRLEDTLVGSETPSEFSQAVWDNWNAKSSVAKRTDGLVADQALVTRLSSLSDAERAGFHFSMGPLSEDFAGFVGLRLNEHVLHTWDIEVPISPTATLSSEASDYIIDTLELIARLTGRVSDVDLQLSVQTTDPRRDFALTLGPDAVALNPSEPEDHPDLELPAEAFIRLVYGRLDADHSPAVEGLQHLVTLRRVFPGP